MGWSIGTGAYGRDIGYGVPAECDKPGCPEQIDRGLSFCCGGYLTDYGCGLYFCGEHLSYRTPRGSDRMVELCPRCYAYKSPYNPKEDSEEWEHWKLVDESWQVWRDSNPEKAEAIKQRVDAEGDHSHDWLIVGS